MIEKYSTVRVDGKILEIISNLSWIKDKVGEVINSPTVDTIEEVDQLLISLSHNSEALKNAIITLVKEITGGAIDENGEMEVDVIPEENGFRM